MFSALKVGPLPIRPNANIMLLVAKLLLLDYPIFLWTAHLTARGLTTPFLAVRNGAVPLLTVPMIRSGLNTKPTFRWCEEENGPKPCMKAGSFVLLLHRTRPSASVVLALPELPSLLYVVMLTTAVMVSAVVVTCPTAPSCTPSLPCSCRSSIVRERPPILPKLPMP